LTRQFFCSKSDAETKAFVPAWLILKLSAAIDHRFYRFGLPASRSCGRRQYPLPASADNPNLSASPRDEPAEQIVLSAREMNADLIVFGHRDRGMLARWLNGSVGESIFHQHTRWRKV